MAMAQAVLVGGKGLLNLHHGGAVSTSKSRTQPLRHSIVTALPTPLPGKLRSSQQCRQHPCLIITASSEKLENQTEKPKKRGRETKLLSLVALPILATIVVTQTEGVYNDRLFIDTYNDWTMPEKMIKDLYMLISLVFCWGCCVFGSMNDPFYESDEYRKAGGNGTSYWIYNVEEVREEEDREELFRQELAEEMEEETKLRQLEDADREKEVEKEVELV